MLSTFNGDIETNHISANTITHQRMRRIERQFVIEKDNYERSNKCLHSCLKEVHEHGMRYS